MFKWSSFSYVCKQYFYKYDIFIDRGTYDNLPETML
jgi:hypothetical protein